MVLGPFEYRSVLMTQKFLPASRVSLPSGVGFRRRQEFKSKFQAALEELNFKQRCNQLAKLGKDRRLGLVRLQTCMMSLRSRFFVFLGGAGL